MPLSASTRPAIGAIVALMLVAACTPAVAGPATGTASPAATSAPTPTVAPTPAPAAAAAPTPVPSMASATVLDTASLGDAFPLKMRMTIPDGWFTLLPPSYAVPAGTLNVLHGDPNGDHNKWQGPGFALVDGAMVRDPAKDTVTGKSDLIPWPASYLDYLAKLPGVEVLDGPRPVTIGGQMGREISVKTPAMAPTIWMKDDIEMLGGPTPAMSRYLVELNVNGTPLLIEFDDGLTDYEGDFQIVKSLLGSIVFEG